MNSNTIAYLSIDKTQIGLININEKGGNGRVITSVKPAN